MSDAENERQKQRIRSFLHNGMRIEDAYPQIEIIEINYLREHNSFVGHNEKDGLRFRRGPAAFRRRQRGGQRESLLQQ